MFNLFFEKIKNYKWLTFASLLIVAGLAIRNIPQLLYSYYNYKGYSVLSNPDLKAFEFINDQLDPEDYFLPVNVSSLFVPASMPLDASLYLNMTKTESAISFVPGKVFLGTAGKVPYLKLGLVNLINEKLDSETLKSEMAGLYVSDYSKKEAIKRLELVPYEKFLDYMYAANVKYIYSGAFVPWGRRLPVEKLDNNPDLSLIYNEGGARIYQLKDKIQLTSEPSN